MDIQSLIEILCLVLEINGFHLSNISKFHKWVLPVSFPSSKFFHHVQILLNLNNNNFIENINTKTI